MDRSKTEDDLIEFLSRPDNFDVALDVYEKFPAVLKALQIKFWQGVKSNLEARMRETPHKFGGWTCGQGRDARPSTTTFFWPWSLTRRSPVSTAVSPCSNRPPVGSFICIRESCGATMFLMAMNPNHLNSKDLPLTCER